MNLLDKLWQWLNETSQDIYGWLDNTPARKQIEQVLEGMKPIEELIAACETCADLDALLDSAPPFQRQVVLEEMVRRSCPQVKEKYQLAEQLVNIQADPSTAIANQVHEFFDSPLAREITEIAGATVFDTIMSMAVGSLEKLDPALLERVRRFLGTVVLISTAPRVAGILTEIGSLGAINTVGDVLKDSYFNLGLGFITWQMTAPILEGAIGKELERSTNLAFRPTRFSSSQMADLFAMGEVSQDEVVANLREAGWRDEDIDAVVRLSYKPLTQGQIMELRKSGTFTEDEAIRRLRILGYSPEDVLHLLELEDADAVAEPKTVLLSTARTAFKNQLIAEDRFREVLQSMDYSPEAVDLEVEVQRLAMQEEARNLSVSQLRSAYISNVLTETDVLHGLTELDFRTDEAQTLLETWKISKAPKVLKLNKGTVLDALASGVLTTEQARSKLREIGYGADDVNLILRTEELQGTLVRPKASVGILVSAVKAHVITAGQLRNELIAQGYSEFDINAIVGVAQFEEPLEVSPAYILRALQAEVISENDATDWLVRLGVARDEAEIMVETAVVEARIEPPKITAGFLLACVRDEIISVDTFVSRLRSLGYSDADIALLTDAANYEPEEPLSVNMVERAYKQGVISRDATLDKLRELGYSATDREQLVQIYEKEMAISQPKATVGSLVTAARNGIIEIGDLQRKLDLYGYSPEDIDIFVGLVTYEPPESTKSLTKSEVLKAYVAFLFDRGMAMRRLINLGYGIDDADILLTLERREPTDTEVHALYLAGVLSLDMVKLSLLAMGFTEEEVEAYAEVYPEEA